MRLVASSDPTAVPRAEAMQLLNERLALATAVCAALDVAGGRYTDDVARAGLDLLRRWVSARYPVDEGGGEPHVRDGLATMTVPQEGGEERMAELLLATAVCSSLAWMYTADYGSDFVNDRNRVSRALDTWRARRPKDPTLWRRPLKGGPPITLPYLGERLSPNELAYVKKQSAARQAAAWNRYLADDLTFGPRQGLRVGVGDTKVEGRWPLVWCGTTE